MRIISILGLLFILLSSCRQGGQENTILTKSDSVLTIDTLIGRRTITDEIAGAAYRKRAIGYFVVTNSDTSDFICIFEESKEGEKVSIDMHFQKALLSYRQRMTELKKILPEAEKDFKFDSLKSIYLGRLILNGDMAIEVTKQYEQKFGTVDKLSDYNKTSEFLRDSKLGTDLNNIFSKYSINVDKVSIEKLFLTTKEELYWASKVETDSTKVPDKILDCMTWVTLKREGK